jgi:hypothetical protein
LLTGLLALRVTPGRTRGWQAFDSHAFYVVDCLPILPEVAKFWRPVRLHAWGSRYTAIL